MTLAPHFPSQQTTYAPPRPAALDQDAAGLVLTDLARVLLAIQRQPLSACRAAQVAGISRYRAEQELARWADDLFHPIRTGSRTYYKLSERGVALAGALSCVRRELGGLDIAAMPTRAPTARHDYPPALCRGEL